MFEFPQEQPFVEGLLKGNATGLTPARALDLDAEELIDGLCVQMLDAVVRLLLRRVPQTGVADVFQQQHPAWRSVGVEFGNGDAEADKKSVQVQVRQFA